MAVPRLLRLWLAMTEGETLQGRRPTSRHCEAVGRGSLPLPLSWQPASAIEDRISRRAIRSVICTQTAASRSTVSGYRSTKRISRAACAFGRARPCSQFSSMRGLVRR